MANNKEKKVLNVPNSTDRGNVIRNVPALRFPEFSGEWEKSKLSNFSVKIVKKNKGNTVTNVLCNSANLGLIPQSNYFDREIANAENTDGYYVIDNGDFVYNPRKSTAAPFGPVNIYEGKEAGIISPLYLCFSVHNIFPKFLYYRFKSSVWHPYVYSHGDSGVRFDRVSIKDDVFFDMPLYKPTQDEEIKIATLLQIIDERITTQNKIIEDLKKLKSAIIEMEYGNMAKSISYIGDFIEQTSKRNKDCAILNVLSVSNSQGFIQQSEQFENRIVASDDTSNYKIVARNDFAFNPARINVGSIARLTTFERGIVSPMYICFRTKDNLLPEYLDYYFESKRFFAEIQKRLEGSVRQCLSFEGLCNIPLCIPTVEVQQQIGKRLSTLAKEIKLEIDFLELLQRQKRFLLHQMFI